MFRFRENSWQFCTTISFFQVLFIVLFGIFCDYDKEWYDPEWKRLLKLNNDTITHEIEHMIKHADEHLTRSYACKYAKKWSNKKFETKKYDTKNITQKIWHKNTSKIPLILTFPVSHDAVPVSAICLHMMKTSFWKKLYRRAINGHKDSMLFLRVNIRYFWSRKIYRKVNCPFTLDE